MESCALFFTLLQKGKEYFEADSYPSTIDSSISLLLCAITWTIFSQDPLARAYMYALLPLTLSLSTNLPPAITFSRNSHQSQILNQVLDYILIGNLCKKEKRKKIWKTRPGCLDHGSVTFFRVFLLFGQYCTWCILHLAHNERSMSSAGSTRFFFFFFYPLIFPLLPLGFGFSKQTSDLNSILYSPKGYIYDISSYFKLA